MRCFFRPWMLFLFFLVSASIPALEAQSVGVSGSAAQQPNRSDEEEDERGTEILGLAEAEPEEEAFVEEIREEAEQLPVFGQDLFELDLEGLSPGPIDPDRYLVAPGDTYLLEVYGELNLPSQELTVTNDLYLNIPEVGRVYLGGQTLSDAEETVVRRLAQIHSSYIDPSNPANSTTWVRLTPTVVQPVRFLVQGEVRRPGSYTLHPSLADLVTGIALAGGIREHGSLREITLRRGGRSMKVDFYSFLLQGRMDQSTLQIQPGDVIFVPLKQKEVTIRGEIRRPARYELVADEGLSELIPMSGGLLPSASLEKSLILRTELNEGLKTIDVNLERVYRGGSNVPLQDEDIINVYSTYMLRLDYVSVRGDGIALPGEYQLQPGWHLSDLIEEAGGLTGEAYVERAALVRTRPDLTKYYETVNLRRVLAGDEEANLTLENLDQLIVYTVQEIEGSSGKIRLRGHVKNPGVFTLYDGLTLFDLLFDKGGFQDPEFLKRTYTERGEIRRVSEKGIGRKLITFDLEALLNGDAEQNQNLQDDDEVMIYSVQDVIPSEHWVTLTGHVKGPGRHVLYEGMTLMDLVEVAGGFQDRDFRRQTFLEQAEIRRETRVDNALETEIIRFDLGALLQGDDTQDRELQSGDEVVIYAAKDFSTTKVVTINGLVKNPGVYPWATNMTLTDLLLRAGGLLEGAYARAEISRIDISRNPGVQTRTLQVDIDSDFYDQSASNSLELKSNDYVFVRKHPDFEEQSVVEVTGEVRFPGRYVLADQGERISDLIQRAGGLRETAYAPAVRLIRDKERVVFNLERALTDPGGDQDLILQPEDSVTIPRFQNVVRVRGAVGTESVIAYRKDSDVDDYIDLSGGFIALADKDSVTITYPDGRVVRSSSGFLGLRKTRVEPMSVITVPERSDARIEF